MPNPGSELAEVEIFVIMRLLYFSYGFIICLLRDSWANMLINIVLGYEKGVGQYNCLILIETGNRLTYIGHYNIILSINIKFLKEINGK